MSAISAAIRIFEPKSAQWNSSGRGRSNIRWDDIAAMLAHVESENPVGYQLLMTLYRADEAQEVALRKNVTLWASERPVARKDVATLICLTAIDILLKRPLTSQFRNLKHLHRLHGSYARREATRIKKLKKLLSYEENKESPSDLKLSHLHEQIRTAKVGIDKWVIAHSETSTRCPRCKGSGVITLPEHNTCPICYGKKWLRPVSRDIERHVQAFVKISSVELTEYLPLIDDCNNWLADQVNTSGDRLQQLFEMNCELQI